MVAPKTGMYREIPIRPELEAILTQTHADVPAGTNRVCHPISANNLTRKIQKLIRAAGLEPWAKGFQSLRSSAENDWKLLGVAEATYSAWQGHDPSVSRKNYVRPTDAEFAAVTGKG